MNEPFKGNCLWYLRVTVFTVEKYQFFKLVLNGILA